MMIPRRRATIHRRDFVDWLRAVVGSGAGADSPVQEFQSRFSDYLGVGRSLATASGREALVLALDAMDVEQDAEILIPAYTLGELVPCLQRRGYKLVPVDVDPRTFNMTAALLDRAAGPRSKVVIATHILGAPCDMNGILAVAAKHGLLVVEDCAHAMGANIGDRKVGTFGDAAIFSFEPTKALPTYGGGMLATNNDRIAGQVHKHLATRKHSRRPALMRTLSVWAEEMVLRSTLYGALQPVLFSERLAGLIERWYRGSHDRARPQTAYTAFQAIVGMRALAELDTRNARCNKLWERMAADLPPEFVPQLRTGHGQPAFHNFVLRCSTRDPVELRRRLGRAGIDVGIGTEVMDNCATILGSQQCPCAAEIVRSQLLLPIYDGISGKQYDHLAGTMHAAAGEPPAT